MDCKLVLTQLENFLKEKVEEAGAEGVVLGLSGGIDSALVAVIAKRVFPEDTLALLIPIESSINDVLHAQLLAQEFNIKNEIIDLDNVYQELEEKFKKYAPPVSKVDATLLNANIKPRLRMLSFYYYSQANNYLVLGTSNKSEISIGYATKYGDSGVDLQILGDLLKYEVYELARYLNIPQIIIDKAPSAGLWEGQTDEGEMGFTYAELDAHLEGKEIAADKVSLIQKMMKNTQHKRETAPIAIVSK